MLERAKAWLNFVGGQISLAYFSLGLTEIEQLKTMFELDQFEKQPKL